MRGALLGVAVYGRLCAWRPGGWVGEAETEVAAETESACAVAAEKRAAWFANFFPEHQRCVILAGDRAVHKAAAGAEVF